MLQIFSDSPTTNMQALHKSDMAALQDGNMGLQDGDRGLQDGDRGLQDGDRGLQDGNRGLLTIKAATLMLLTKRK